MEPFQVKMPRGSIKGTQTMFPLASPQVVQTGKHSLEVRIAEPLTPYKFLLILALARLTAVSVLEGQGGHSSHRGQASCCLLSVSPWKRLFAVEGKVSYLHIIFTAGPQKPYYHCLQGTQLLIGVKVFMEVSDPSIETLLTLLIYMSSTLKRSICIMWYIRWWC